MNTTWENISGSEFSVASSNSKWATAIEGCRNNFPEWTLWIIETIPQWQQWKYVQNRWQYTKYRKYVHHLKWSLTTLSWYLSTTDSVRMWNLPMARGLVVAKSSSVPIFICIQVACHQIFHKWSLWLICGDRKAWNVSDNKMYTGEIYLWMNALIL